MYRRSWFSMDNFIKVLVMHIEMCVDVHVSYIQSFFPDSFEWNDVITFVSFESDNINWCQYNRNKAS